MGSYNSKATEDKSSSGKPSQAAEPVRAAEHKAGKASGGYLVFSPESTGVLTLHWADEKVPGALAYFAPSKPVPQHKKTQNAGRMELIRGIGSNKKKMYEGVTHFVKEAALFNGDLVQFDDSFFDMWYYDGSSVHAVNKGKPVPCSRIRALAVLPHQNASFDGVQKTDIIQFANTAAREGACWKA